jgi:Nucleotide-diphospho-sugar transferase
MAAGCLYVALGRPYLEAAQVSARSVRSVTPGIPIAVATDEPAPTGFDAVVALADTDGYRAKVLGMLASPFDRTLFLDADTYAAADVAELFHVLDTFDLAAAQAPNRVTLPLDDVPDAFPELNTGVVAFRRNAAVKRFLHTWLEEYDRLKPLRPPSQDQPAFRRALYTATDVRLTVLPTEFNVRFGMAGFYNQRVRILHGPGDEDDYRAVAALLNGRVASWRHRGVFIGQTLFDSRARIVGRFPKKRGREA